MPGVGFEEILMKRLSGLADSGSDMPWCTKSDGVARLSLMCVERLED